MASANEQVLEVLQKQLEALQDQKIVLEKEFAALKATIVKGERLGLIAERKKLHQEESLLKEQYAERIQEERQKYDRERSTMRRKNLEQGVGREEGEELLAKLEGRYRKRRNKLSREFAGEREEVQSRYSAAASEEKVEKKLAEPRKEYEEKVGELQAKIGELEGKLAAAKPAPRRSALPNAFAPPEGTWPDRPPTAKDPQPRGRRRRKPEPPVPPAPEVPPVPERPQPADRKGFLPHQTRIQEGLKHKNPKPSGHIPTLPTPKLQMPEEGPDTRIQEPTRKIARDKREADRAAKQAERDQARQQAKVQKVREREAAKHRALVDSLRRIHAAAMEREGAKSYGHRLLNRMGLGDVQVEGARGMLAGLRSMRAVGFSFENTNALATGAARLMRGAPAATRGIAGLLGSGGAGGAGGGGMATLLGGGGGAAGAGGFAALASNPVTWAVAAVVAIAVVIAGLKKLADSLSASAAKVLEYNRRYTDASALMSSIFTRVDIARFQMRREMGDRLAPAAWRLAQQQIRTERAGMEVHQLTETVGMQWETLKSAVAEGIYKGLDIIASPLNRINELLGWNNPGGMNGGDFSNWIVNIANLRLGVATPRPAPDAHQAERDALDRTLRTFATVPYWIARWLRGV